MVTSSLAACCCVVDGLCWCVIVGVQSITVRTSETFCFKAFSTSRKTGSASTQSCSAKSRSVCINVTSFCLFHSESTSSPGITNFTSVLIFYGLSRENLLEFFLKNVSWMSPWNLVEIGRAGFVAPCRTQIGSDTLPVKRNRRACSLLRWPKVREVALGAWCSWLRQSICWRGCSVL